MKVLSVEALVITVVIPGDGKGDPLMANLTPAALLRLLPSVSAMDVPTRQSYLRAVFQPDQRSSARGIIGAAKDCRGGDYPSFAGFSFFQAFAD